MNEAEIANLFIRAAEVDRATKEHVGPAPVRSMPLPYVHDQADKNGWGKAKERRIVNRGKLIQGDWLEEGADPLAEERKAFWERLGMMPTAEELSRLDGLYDLLMMVGNEGERRSLLAWARSKVGGKAFRRWCFQIEGIHPETGRKRKNRALARIYAQINGSVAQNCENRAEGQLHVGPENSDVSDTLDEDVGRRDGLNNWAADDAFSPFISDQENDFSWAQKRNERRRQRDAKKRRQCETAQG